MKIQVKVKLNYKQQKIEEFDIYDTLNTIDTALSKWIGKKAFP